MNQQTLDGFNLPSNRREYGKTQTQGQQAVKSGADQEAQIEFALSRFDLSVERQKVVCTGIYGTEIRADFVIGPCRQFPNGLIVESKWQDATGSVDEKFPYLVENIRTRYPAPCIVVLDGNGYRPGAADWMRRQVDGRKLIGVFTFTEFRVWCNRNLCR